MSTFLILSGFLSLFIAIVHDTTDDRPGVAAWTAFGALLMIAGGTL